jgi:hypothetical protein
MEETRELTCGTIPPKSEPISPGFGLALLWWGSGLWWRGNVQQAALLLGISRQTVRLKLRDLGLSVPRQGVAKEDDPV